MNESLKASLSDSLGFMYILNSINSGIRNYLFVTEHWNSINKSIQKVHENYDKLVPFLESIEELFHEISDILSVYKWVLRGEISLNHSYYKEIEEKFDDFLNGSVTHDVINNPVIIHEKIAESEDIENLKLLFLFYLEHVCLTAASHNLTTKISDIGEGVKQTERYNIETEGHRLPEAFFRLLKLGEINLKISKFNYTYELDELDFIISDNFKVIHKYLQYHSQKLYSKEIYNNIYDIYPIDLSKNLSKSLTLLSKSNLYSDVAEFSASKLNKLYDVLSNIRRSKITLGFDRPIITNFRCNLYLQAKNAFKYGLIPEDKHLYYQQKLAGVEKKQFQRVRKHLSSLNYLISQPTPPAIRSPIWASRNEKFYMDELKPAFQAENKVDLDLESELYSGYFTKYVEETAFKAYRTQNSQELIKKGDHLQRLISIYGFEGSYSNLLKGMYLDSQTNEKFVEYFNFLAVNSSHPEMELQEIISLQNKEKYLLRFSGEMLLGQAYWVRQKKLVHLFHNEIIEFFDTYIKENNLDYLPTKLLKQYTDKSYIESNFSNIKKQWIEENFKVSGKFPYSKEQIFKVIKEFRLKPTNQDPYYDLYRDRFDLIKKSNEEIEFDFFKIPKVNIPHVVLDLIKLHLTKKAKEVLKLFKEETGVKGGDDRWVSEKYLYFKVKEAFPEFPVIRHATPEWLGRQHFDIYIPTKKIAIEYNGRQHYKPIEYFGGKEGLEHRKKLDRIKLKKARKNDAIVIIHKYDDDIEKTVEQLRSYFG